MKALTINREFLVRHLAVCLLMLGLGGWFGFDACVAYPRMEAAALYEKIEKAKPSEGFPLEAFKRQKIHSQYGFMALCLVASALLAVHLAAVARFRFSFDEAGFEWKGKRYALADIASVDRAQWKKKGIVHLALKDGRHVTLDAWHHSGVKDFEKMV